MNLSLNIEISINNLWGQEKFKKKLKAEKLISDRHLLSNFHKDRSYLEAEIWE